jgi:lipopolysaccharide/colanic/teichoic acid biosynthesis glycosyltransferase
MLSNTNIALEEIPSLSTIAADMSVSYNNQKVLETPSALKHILVVVEDQSKIKPEFAQEKFDVSFTTIGLAFTQAKKVNPDAIFVSSDLENYTDKYLSALREYARKKAIPFVLHSSKFNAIARNIAAEFGFDEYHAGNITDAFLKRLDFIRKLKDYKNQRGEKPYAINPHHDKSAVKMWTLKRALDIAVALSALLFLSPLLLVIALVIKMESKGPVFYISKRAGNGYKIFNFYKFRSMRTGADAELKKLAHMNQYTDSSDSVFFKIKNDPRVTRFGSFLRNTSLDELPQLFNVLIGDMSLVGNRPLPLYEAEKLTKDQIAWRFLAPAGITGLWQVTKRGKENMSEEERIQLDMQYAMNNSFLYDMKILWSTIPALLQKEKV